MSIRLLLKKDIAAEKRHPQDVATKEVMTRQWKDLVLGVASVQELLNWKGKAWYRLGVVALGVVLAFIAGGVIYGVVLLISRGVNLNLSSLVTLSNIQAVLTLVSTGGITLSLLATKIWSGLKDFEPWWSVRLLRFHSLRVGMKHQK
jgi:hypothetical protein